MQRAHLTSLFFFATAGAAALVAGACTSDGTGPGGDTTGGDDAGSSSALTTDAGGCGSDGGGHDQDAAGASDGSVGGGDDGGGGGDAGVEASGPEVTEVVASSGSVMIWPDALFGYFFEDNTVVHFASTPECVLHVRSATKGFSAAGNLRVGGSFCGQDGGPAAGGVTYTPGVPPLGSENAYEEFLDPGTTFYPPAGALDVLIQTTGTATVPAMPVQTLKSPGVATVQVLSPTVPASGPLEVAHDQPFDVTWTVPSGDLTGQRMVVSLSSMATEAHVGDVRCGFPLAAGKATIPARVLGEAWTRLGASATVPLDGAVLRILAGDQREVVVGTASYVLELGRHDGTSFGDETQVVVK